MASDAIDSRLADLPVDEWVVLRRVGLGNHGAPVGHVLIGPTGVFTVNYRHLTGHVAVYERAILHGGRKTDYVTKSVLEALRIRQCLGNVLGRPIRVRNTLVLSGADVNVMRTPLDLVVLRPEQLPQWFLEQPSDDLDRDDRAAIQALVTSSSTWAPAPLPRAEVPADDDLDRSPDDGLVLRRSSRRGRDRIHVITPDGRSLGWLDLRTDRVHAVVAHERHRVDCAIDRWRREGGAVLVTQLQD